MASATLLLSCGGRAPQPVAPLAEATPGPLVSLADHEPLFFAGERMTFEVTFRGIEGGRARVAVGAPELRGGRRVLALRAEAETAGLVAVFKEIRDDVSTWLDADSALPLRSTSFANTSGKTVHVDATFEIAGQAVVEIDIDGKHRRVVRKLPAGETYDPLGALLVMRAWQAAPGTRAHIYTLGGHRLWRTELTVIGIEEVRTPLGGTVRALRLSGVSTRMTPALADDTRKPPRRFSVWFAEDPARTPLRVTAHTELGDVEAVATSYEVGE